MTDASNDHEKTIPLGEEDWRLTGQDDVLAGAALVRKRYTARSETWEHEHCAFCWAKFMDPEFSPEHRKFIEDNADVRTEGYTTTDEHPQGADFWWICDTCFTDFLERFRWRVVAES